jgi:hypothetical protein
MPQRIGLPRTSSVRGSKSSRCQLPNPAINSGRPTLSFSTKAEELSALALEMVICFPSRDQLTEN